MSGGSPRHNSLGLRAGSLLDRTLSGTKCVAFSALRPGTKDVITNPSVVVEVLSRSTEGSGALELPGD